MTPANQLTREQSRNLAASGFRVAKVAAQFKRDLADAKAGKPVLTPATRRFFAALSDIGLPQPVTEHRFHYTRRWRLDYFWPSQNLALEVQGSIFTQGRHTRGASLLKEWEKLNTAAAAGIRFLYCQPSALCSQETLNFIRLALRSP